MLSSFLYLIEINQHKWDNFNNKISYYYIFFNHIFFFSLHTKRNKQHNQHTYCKSVSYENQINIKSTLE